MKTMLPALLVAPLLALTPVSSDTTHAPIAVEAAQGVIVESTSRDLTTDETWTNTMYILEEDLVMEFSDPRNNMSGSMVHLADPGEWIMNDDARQTFIRMTAEDMAELAEQIGAMMERVEQMMANIPESQREMIMNSGAMPGMDMLGDGLPTIEMRETGDAETREGYQTRRWDLYVGEKRTSEMWIADWSDVPEADAMRPAMTAFGEMWRSFMESMPTGMMGGDSMTALLDFNRGVPIVTYEIDDEGNRVMESVISSITTGDVDPGLFGPKEGYEEQEMEFNMNE